MNTITYIHQFSNGATLATRHPASDFSYMLEKARNKRHQEWCIVRDRDGLSLAQSKNFTASKSITPFGIRSSKCQS